MVQLHTADAAVCFASFHQNLGLLRYFDADLAIIRHISNIGLTTITNTTFQGLNRLVSLFV